MLLVWNTSERRNATVGTQPYNKKGTTNDALDIHHIKTLP